MASMEPITITMEMDANAEEFIDLLRSVRNRLDEHERQVQELWRRIHSLNEMIEARDQH